MKNYNWGYYGTGAPAPEKQENTDTSVESGSRIDPLSLEFARILDDGLRAIKSIDTSPRFTGRSHSTAYHINEKRVRLPAGHNYSYAATDEQRQFFARLNDYLDNCNS